MFCQKNLVVLSQTILLPALKQLKLLTKREKQLISNFCICKITSSTNQEYLVSLIYEYFDFKRKM